MKKFSVHSIAANRDYPVSFIEDIKQKIQDITNNYPTHCLIDKNIYLKYKGILDEKKLKSCKLIEASEDQKSLEKVIEYINFLLENAAQKNHKILVIGGGLVQDIGSFTAHLLLRGIDWIFIPTTLLSMADSCIGSKSGINVGKYKNQVGAFHPPTEVCISPSFLDTLPQSELVNGIGEIIKHALIKGGKQYEFISKNISKLSENKKLATEIIYKSLLIKKEIIEEDELEKGIRKLLNYGHTFGHALEGYTNHKISHGIGVLIGVDLANFISLKEKLMSLSEFNKIHNFIYPFISSYEVRVTDYDIYMEYLSRDKKVIGDEVKALLSEGIGKVKIVKTKLDTKLKDYIREYFDKYAKR
jgi:3-dehydroquinate synthase